MPLVLANVGCVRSGPSSTTGFIGCYKTGGFLPQKKERKKNPRTLGCLCSSQGLSRATRKQGKPRHHSITSCVHGPWLRRQQQQGAKGPWVLAARQCPRWPLLIPMQTWALEPRCLPCGSLPSPWHRLPSPTSPGGRPDSQQK